MSAFRDPEEIIKKKKKRHSLKEKWQKKSSRLICSE